ncbi:MAG: S49 family peptidase [Pirellulaceae bacterium]
MSYEILCRSEYSAGATGRTPQPTGETAVVALDGEIDRALINRAVAQLDAARISPSVSRVLLYCNSPGGRSPGMTDLADAIRRTAAAKQVVAYADDICASACYWAASQAGKILANRGALVGSIGTYTVLVDVSAALNRAGVRAHVVRAGQFKAIGALGSEVSAEQLAEVQRVVNGINGQFTAAVQSGRRMSAAELAAVADGRIHTAQDALRLRLVDGIASLSEVLAGIDRPQSKGQSVNAQEQFNELVTDKVARGMPRSRAVAAVIRANPELQGQLIAEANADRPASQRPRWRD